MRPLSYLSSLPQQRQNGSFAPRFGRSVTQEMQEPTSRAFFPETSQGDVFTKSHGLIKEHPTAYQALESLLASKQEIPPSSSHKMVPWRVDSSAGQTLLGRLLESHWEEEQPDNQLVAAGSGGKRKHASQTQSSEGYVPFQALSSKEAQVTKEQVQAMVVVDPKAKLSHADEQEVESLVMNHVPLDHLKTALKNGTRIVVSNQASQLWPELKGDGPSNSLEGQTFDQTPAVYAPEKNQVAIFMTPLKKLYTHPEARQERLGNVLRHEIAHALDYGDSSGQSQSGKHLSPLSSSEAFKLAYQKDLKELQMGQNTPQRWLYDTAPKHVKNSIRYYASQVEPSIGRKETFAELVATISRGETDRYVKNLTLWMPHSAEYVRQLLAKKQWSPYTYTERTHARPPSIPLPHQKLTTQALLDDAVKAESTTHPAKEDSQAS